MKSIKAVFFNTTLLVICLTFLGRATGFVREQIIANYYGTSSSADMFVTAFTLPQYISNIFGGVITVSFIPLFIEMNRNKDSRKLKSFSRGYFNLILKLIIVYVIVTFCSSWWVVDRMFASPNQLTWLIYCLMIPVTIAMVLALFFTSFLNAQKSFVIPTLSPLIMSITFIITLMLLPNGVKSLVWATILSSLTALIFIIPFAMRKGFNFSYVDPLKRDDYLSIASTALPMAIGSIFLQSTTVIDKFFTKLLPEGSIAALNYAFKLTQLPSGIFATAVSTIIFPALAVMVSKKDEKGAFTVLDKGIRLTLFITCPAIICLILFSRPLTQLLFERGAFDAAATNITATGVVLYSLGIIGASLTMLISRYFYASKKIWIPVLSNIGATVLNIIISFILVGSMGGNGLAISYSTSVTVNFIILTVIYIVKQRESIPKNLVWPYFKIFVVTSVTLIIFWRIILSSLIEINILSMFIGMSLICVCYFALSVLLKVDEGVVTIQKVRGIINRTSRRTLNSNS
ncbi:murein biosynthesis integral membrane protein MurJ [Paenibacillus pasadenensis]|uniref:murein biosynthesis integral membrane protein MurJ n=1 Tax=Paenibacillus pasadenensis TaxID=217090 RepID=UPI00203DFE56|nr:murein biosynthesis integral membrane protein MurJ [Paenibacillus pasadenensis]MCM3749153.1 murein biosynthesis integral membrane protein MurJ [Paenibacillus pasadenensis]